MTLRWQRTDFYTMKYRSLISSQHMIWRFTTKLYVQKLFSSYLTYFYFAVNIVNLYRQNYFSFNNITLTNFYNFYSDKFKYNKEDIEVFRIWTNNAQFMKKIMNIEIFIGLFSSFLSVFPYYIIWECFLTL